jgi:phosphotransferase system HPr (HPr) family protein
LNRFEITVNLAEGLHTRPAADIVATCRDIKGKLISPNGEASLSSILSLMTLGVQKGETVYVEIENSFDESVVDSIRAILKG